MNQLTGTYVVDGESRIGRIEDVDGLCVVVDDRIYAASEVWPCSETGTEVSGRSLATLYPNIFQ